MSDDIKNIIVNILAATIFAILATIAGYTISLLPSRFWTYEYLLKLNNYDVLMLFLLLVLLVFLLTLLFFRMNKQVKCSQGRERIMGESCRLVEKFATDSKTPFLSTRVTYWKSSEHSKNRVKFRSLITQKLYEKIPIRRLWQIQTLEDLTRLEKYLDEYSEFDNYSVKVIYDKQVLIPDILCIKDRVANISFPEINSPREISRSIAFYNKSYIRSIESYFNVLWELALPLNHYRL
ncbi:MAG: hypothetical protein AAF228_08505 [Pseudomonadota bacterium]